MSDTNPPVTLGLTPGGDPVLLLGEDGEAAHDMATLLRLVPGIVAPGRAEEAAVLVNHLAQGVDFRVITDPAGFEQAYMARLAGEDPAAPFRDGVLRLRDFGVPAFGTITPPRWDGGTLVFHAADANPGLPYRVTVPDLAATPDYEPLPLSPLPPAPGASGARRRVPPTAAELEEGRSFVRDDGTD